MRLDIGEADVDFRDPVRVVGGFRLVQQSGALDVGRKHEIDQLAVAARRFLLDAADARAARDGSRAALRRDLAADQPEQGGLAGAVAADESDLGALGQSHAGGIEQQARPEPVGEISDGEHGAL